MKEEQKRIAIIGGGPSALFMFKRLVDTNPDAVIFIYERGDFLGAGMPYSGEGACDEHITNVSPNEIPEMVTSVKEWIATAPHDVLRHYNISDGSLNEYKVLPRLFFGQYLHSQFDLLLKLAKRNRLETHVHLNTAITDIIDRPESNQTEVVTGEGISILFDNVIICTGHEWPKKYEGQIPGYFESPYPPAKLGLKINYPVALRGSSLTAIDAVRTLARHNGVFSKGSDGMPEYILADESAGFKLIMHSLNGLMPALRFHLDDSHLQKNAVLSKEAIEENREQNEGFLSLDFIFEKNFKEPLMHVDPDMYEHIKNMRMEDFVDEIMLQRERIDAMTLFKAEYAEAEKSIKRKQSIHWKEMLAVLSFAMNYPAKHFSAEDMMRLQKVLKPLISIVIAFVPQSSAMELIALHDAGLLEIVDVDKDSYVEPGEKEGTVIHFTTENNECAVPYKLFIDCIGQPQMQFQQFPFKSMLDKETITPAMIQFRSAAAAEEARTNNPDDIQKSDTGNYYLKVPGIAINDHFQVLDRYGAINPRIYIMAVPYIGGYNPDYSGLDFCEAASAIIATRLLGLES